MEIEQSNLNYYTSRKWVLTEAETETKVDTGNGNENETNQKKTKTNECANVSKSERAIYSLKLTIKVGKGKNLCLYFIYIPS